MATKARSGSTRTPRSTSKTARSTTTTKKAASRTTKSASTARKARPAARTSKVASTTRRKSTARPVSRVSTNKQPLKSKPFAIAHRHLIGGMAVLALLITGVVGYMHTSSRYVAYSSHSASATVKATGPIKGLGGKCLDNQSARVANGNRIQMYWCNNTVAQKWSVYTDGSLRVQGYCLDVKSASTASGATVQLYRCNGTAAQKWTIKSNGTIVNPNSGNCLDVRSASTANGAVVWMYRCNGTAAQKWVTPTSSSTSPTPTPAPTPTPTPAPSNPTPAPTPAPSTGANTGGSGGSRTNMTFQKYTAAGYTSQYHLYAAGLDWSKPVGILIYGDGSGEYGLKNPSSSYLLAGSNGLIAVAKKNNMVLLTPFAPNKACADGDGSCWYMGNPAGYVKWAEALVNNVYSKYPISKNRVAMGGYSSGAQLASRFWTPSGAAQRTMTDGVIVSISCGGNPGISETSYTSAFKSNVHMNWNTGDRDTSCPHTATWSTNGGYNHYTGKGIKTSRDLISGLGHDRSGKFGGIMDAQIREHVPPSR